MAPMTRSRASEQGDVPSPHAAVYYAQRATAGLIITEATNISAEAKGYSLTPGIYTAEQAAEWRRVSDAVHQTPDARIFMQLWHVGRIAAQEVSGLQPVAPSAQSAPARVWVRRSDGWSGLIPCDPAREMTRGDIARVVEDFRSAARAAVDAGFDGVELHAANGYLLDQFLREGTNRRDDEYGGSVINRLRFLDEVVTAVVRDIGPQRVGVRVSPIVGFEDTQDEGIAQTLLAAAGLLDGLGIAYLHLEEGDAATWGTASTPDTFRADVRDAFRGALIVAHEYGVDRAEQVVSSGAADAVAFGRPFIGNPDLVARIRTHAGFADSDTNTWYGGDEIGYTDYETV